MPLRGRQRKKTLATEVLIYDEKWVIMVRVETNIINRRYVVYAASIATFTVSEQRVGTSHR